MITGPGARAQESGGARSRTAPASGHRLLSSMWCTSELVSVHSRSAARVASRSSAAARGRWLTPRRDHGSVPLIGLGTHPLRQPRSSAATGSSSTPTVTSMTAASEPPRPERPVVEGQPREGQPHHGCDALLGHSARDDEGSWRTSARRDPPARSHCQGAVNGHLLDVVVPLRPAQRIFVLPPELSRGGAGALRELRTPHAVSSRCRLSREDERAYDHGQGWRWAGAVTGCR